MSRIQPMACLWDIRGLNGWIMALYLADLAGILVVCVYVYIGFGCAVGEGKKKYDMSCLL